ncbi:MAG: FtsX-like permease family protein [Planctomycetota bacterium]
MEPEAQAGSLHHNSQAGSLHHSWFPAPVRQALWVLGAAAAIALSVVMAAWVGRPREVQLIIPEVERTGAAAGLDLERIRNDVRRLSAARSRLTGYPGADAAFTCISEELDKLGLREKEVQEFQVAVPVVHTTFLEAATAEGAVRLELHPLWPNLARTCQTGAAGIRGPLVDLGRGKDADLAGKHIRGAIAVLDWDTDAEWLSVPEFGGKAVLFRANPNAGTSTARRKFLTVPADVPRFYVAGDGLPVLEKLLAMPRGSLPEVTLKCEMAWQQAAAKNILVRACQGQESPDVPEADRAPLLVHAFYDSISVVPDLSPGAEQACGAATLLELARFLAALKEAPQRPIYLLFTGGHGQALAGMTHFVRQLRDGLAAKWAGPAQGSLLAHLGQPGLFIGLDLSTHSGQMGLFCQGHFRGEWDERLQPKFKVLGLMLAKFVASLTPNAGADGGPFVDCINTKGRGWWSYFPYRAPFESELPALAGFPAVTLATINDRRRHVDTPDDRFGELDFSLLEEQICAAPGRRAGLASLVQAFAFWKGPFASTGLDNVAGRLQGRVIWLDQQKDFVPSQPLSGATVFLKTRRQDKHLLGTRGGPVALTDSKGKFTFDGLIQGPANGEFGPRGNCTVEAYGVADRGFIEANVEACRQYLAASPAQDLASDGALLFAADLARPDEYPWKVDVTGQEQSRNAVCFSCKAVTLYGMTDPRGYLAITDLQILNAATQSPPFQFGRSASDEPAWNSDERCCTLWAAPSLRVRITMGLGFRERRLVLLNNSLEDPIGTGFPLDSLDQIPSMVLQGAGDMLRLDQSRFEKLQRHGVNNPRVREMRAQSAAHLDAATKALAACDYAGYRSAGEKCWALESKAYSELLSMTNNLVQGVLFYLALLLPFAYCLERLVFASGTIRKRIVWMVAIFAASFTVLALIHPAFRFTMTPFIVLLAFIILALALTVSFLITGRFDALLREQKQLLTGVHEEAANVGGIAVRAIDLGIANIRRRPQRGFLTALTIILVTFTLLSFTSIVPTVSISKLVHREGHAAYRGLLARDRNWTALPEPLYYSLKRSALVGRSAGSPGDPAGRPTASVVAGRAWFFSDNTGRVSQIDLAPAEARASLPGCPGHFAAVSLLCLEHTEPAITGLDSALLAGRWFKSEDEVAIILPGHVAQQLGLGAQDIGKGVMLFGQKVPLAGILDEKRLDEVKDLDGEPLTPVDFVRQEEVMAQKSGQADTLEKYEHHPADQIAILPLNFGLRLGAALRSVAIKTAAGLEPAAEAEGYVRRSNLTILACDGPEARAAPTLFAALDTSSLHLTGQIAIPLLLGFIMVLSTMLGSVYERRREIFVYNSVGLSPGNVAALFLAESSVYAVLGACLGYLLGQVLAKCLLLTGALSGLSLNYSAGTTVFVSALSMLIVMLSTLYPARQAFHAAIPESRREGGASAEHFATDAIAFYLPFVATPSSVLDIQAYMHEFLDGLQGMAVGELAVDNLAAGVETGEEQKMVPVLSFRAWLAPFDLGISHDVELRMAYRAERGVYQCHLKAVRFSGDQENWRRLTPRFITALRKQLLMWRTLPAAAHQSYAERGQALFLVSPLPCGERADVSEANAG